MASDELTSRPGPRPGRETVLAGPGRRRLVVVALVLAALNLRPAVTSLGPVLEEVRDSLAMSGTVAGLLTSIPAACFAAIGSTAPRLARRYGPSGAVAVGALLLTAGLVLRPLVTSAVLFVALSALALAGIALANVLLPAVVKQYFPDRVGAMTGLYSMALNAGASTAAAVTVPVTEAFGGDWRFGLGAWAVLAAMAVPPWLAFARRARATGTGGGAGASAAPKPPSGVALTRDPTAWALVAYFGLQASSAYIIIGWLAQVFRDAGLSAGTA
ncbi:MAG TPA: MFS transporter, partial [Streptomyces sp.]|nr:MFS transporter [Streptomyces sp.]